MEEGDNFSALGFAGTLRIWRAAVCVLSAGVVDAGSAAECGVSMDGGGERLHMGRAGAGGDVDVCAGAAMARQARCALRGRAVRGESLSSGDRLLAERIRRTAGELPGAAAVAVGVEGG